MSVKIYHIGNKEIHMPEENEFVCIVWKGFGRDPYIDFLNICTKNTICEDEDSPFLGELSIGFARQIQRELDRACKYFEVVSKGEAIQE